MWSTKTVLPWAGGSEQGPVALQTQVAAGVLSNKRRCDVIQYLSDAEEVELGELAEYVAKLENGGDITSSERKTVYVALHQNHLPKMDSLEVVDYDKHRKVIRRGVKYDGTLELLNRIQEYTEA